MAWETGYHGNQTYIEIFYDNSHLWKFIDLLTWCKDPCENKIIKTNQKS